MQKKVSGLTYARYTAALCQGGLASTICVNLARGGTNLEQKGASTNTRTRPATICHTPEMMHMGEMEMVHHTPMNMATGTEQQMESVKYALVPRLT